MDVFSGGVANEITVNRSGYLYVSSGGTATIAYNPWRGTIYSSAGATVTYLERDAKAYYGGNGGLISKGDVFTGLTVNGNRSALVYSGGVANKTTVNYSGYLSGYLYVYNGGTANETTVNGYGSMYISSGGKVTGALTLADGAV